MAPGWKNGFGWGCGEYLMYEETYHVMNINKLYTLALLFYTELSTGIFTAISIYIIDQAWGEDGRIFAFLWTETKLRSIKMQKENEANTQPSWPN